MDDMPRPRPPYLTGKSLAMARAFGMPARRKQPRPALIAGRFRHTGISGRVSGRPGRHPTKASGAPRRHVRMAH